ncbi:MAG: tetratricopeptide repeat protein [Myxococcota bacterium]
MTEKQTVRMEIVETLLDAEETLRALELIRVMRADGVDDPNLDLLHGIALRQQGMAEEAERLMIQSQARDPRNPDTYRELCVLYADFERVDEAIEACRKSTDLDPNNAKAWNNLGYLLLMARDDSKAAKEALQRAVEIDSTVARYRNNLAFAQAAAGDHRGALRTFMTTGTPADAHYNVGTAFERAGDEVTALTYYRRALKMDAEHLSADEAVKRLASATHSEEK